MERLMGKIIDVREVQRELDRAARDAKHGPAAVRAGRFVHGNVRDDRAADPKRHRMPQAPANAAPRGHKPVR
jgi:hypothetical protein